MNTNCLFFYNNLKESSRQCTLRFTHFSPKTSITSLNLPLRRCNIRPFSHNYQEPTKINSSCQVNNIFHTLPSGSDQKLNRFQLNHRADQRTQNRLFQNRNKKEIIRSSRFSSTRRKMPNPTLSTRSSHS